MGLAAIIEYYKGGTRADGTPIAPNDAPEIIELLNTLWATGNTETVARGVLAADMIWHEDLNLIPGLTDLLIADINKIEAEGMKAAVADMMETK